MYCRMQRAASVTYTIDTSQPEQPLLQFLIPNNKVEYFSDSSRSRYMNLGDVSIQSANLRRHSSGNCEISNKNTVSNLGFLCAKFWNYYVSIRYHIFHRCSFTRHLECLRLPTKRDHYFPIFGVVNLWHTSVSSVHNHGDLSFFTRDTY